MRIQRNFHVFSYYISFSKVADFPLEMEACFYVLGNYTHQEFWVLQKCDIVNCHSHHFISASQRLQVSLSDRSWIFYCHMVDILIGRGKNLLKLAYKIFFGVLCNIYHNDIYLKTYQYVNNVSSGYIYKIFPSLSFISL